VEVRRPAQRESRLIRSAASLHSIHALAAALVALAAVIAVVAFQPIGAPWWINASPDASYTASGIDMMAGQHTLLLDQPGMPLQDLMAMTTETRYIAHKLTSEHETQVTYASQRLLHLDDSRIFFRGYAVLFFLFATTLAFSLLWRLLGSPWWGTAGTLLFVSTPGLPAMSIQYGPDVLLAGLVLVVGYLIVRAAERRDAWLYALATLLLGLTTTVKVAAAGLVLPLALALLTRPPGSGWGNAFIESGRRWLRRYRVPLLAFFAVWLVFCATFDRSRVPLDLNRSQTLAVSVVAGVPLAYAAMVAILFRARPLRRIARGPLGPLGPVLAAAFAAGLLLPGTFAINDLPEMLVRMGRSLRHGGVDRLAPGVAGSWSELGHTPVLQALILLAVAGVASGIGLVVREAGPSLWFGGSAATFLMATSHVGPASNFAPAFVLSIPPALWLARRMPRPAPPIAALALVALAFIPALRDLPKPRDAARLQERRWAAIDAIGAKVITKPGIVALSDDSAPIPDVRWHDYVQQVVSWTPAYPYRFLPDSQLALDTAGREHLLPAYYIGSLPVGLTKTETVPLQFGSYTLQPVPSDTFPGLEVGTARLLAGPGIDRPYNHPDARYDSRTGYYRDSSGHYWDLYGDAIQNPPPRSNG